MEGIIFARYQTTIFLGEHWLQTRLQSYSEAIQNKGAPLTKCWGFIDGTLRKTCRPNQDQRLFYNGKDRDHGLKHQSVVTPDGMVAHMSKGFEGVRHDCGMLAGSGLQEAIKSKPAFNDYYLYGDPGYFVTDWLLCPYRGNLTPQQEQFNKDMSVCRIVVEWGFGHIIKLWAFADYSKNLKVPSSPRQPVLKLIFLFVLDISSARGKDLHGGHAPHQLSHLCQERKYDFDIFWDRAPLPEGFSSQRVTVALVLLFIVVIVNRQVWDLLQLLLNDTLKELHKQHLLFSVRLGSLLLEFMFTFPQLQLHLLDLPLLFLALKLAKEILLLKICDPLFLFLLLLGAGFVRFFLVSLQGVLSITFAFLPVFEFPFLLTFLFLIAFFGQSNDVRDEAVLFRLLQTASGRLRCCLLFFPGLLEIGVSLSSVPVRSLEP